MSDSFLVSPVTGTPLSAARAINGTTLAVNQEARVASALGAATVFLPAEPGDGNVCAIVDFDGVSDANPITINGNGKLIDGAATFVLDVAGGVVFVVYDAGQYRRVVSPRVFQTGNLLMFRATDIAASAPASLVGPSVNIEATVTDVTIDAAADVTINAGDTITFNATTGLIDLIAPRIDIQATVTDVNIDAVDDIILTAGSGAGNNMVLGAPGGFFLCSSQNDFNVDTENNFVVTASAEVDMTSATDTRLISNAGDVRLTALSPGQAIRFAGAVYRFRDSNNSHDYVWTPADLAADRIVNLPLLTGTDQVTCDAHPTTLTGKTLSGTLNTISNLAASAISSGQLATARGGLAIDTSALSGRLKLAAGVFSVMLFDVQVPAADSLNANSGTQDFATTYSIPANTIVAGTVLRVTMNFVLTTSAAAVAACVRLNVGGTQVYSGTLTAPPNSLTNIPFSLQFDIVGTAAAGAAAAVLTHGVNTFPAGSIVFAPMNQNVVAQPVNLATNGAMIIQPRYQTSGSTAGNSMRLTSMIVEQLN